MRAARARCGLCEQVLVCAEQPAGMQAVSDKTQSIESIRLAFFQNCLARANGFIDQAAFEKAHASLVNAVARSVSTRRPR